jgi:hypothetical protein
LRRAPEERLNSHFLALKDIFIRQSVPTSVPAEQLVLMLLAVGRAEALVLTLLTDLMPGVDGKLAHVITSLACRNEAFTSILMLDNLHLRPYFYGASSFNFGFRFDGTEENLLLAGARGVQISFLPKIVEALGARVFASPWFSKAFLLLIPDFMILNQFSVHIRGDEVIACSLCDLQKQASKLEWLSCDFVVIHADALLNRQEWSMLELAIVLLNPIAVQVCLRGISASFKNQKRILELARLMRSWMQDSEYIRRAERILKILGISEGEEEEEQKQEQLALAPARYCIQDLRNGIRYETVPSSTLK